LADLPRLHPPLLSEDLTRLARRARSARRGNRVVGHRVGGIAIWPDAPPCAGHQGGGTQITQICTQMDADSFLHRIGGSARVGIGRSFCGLRAPRCSASVATTSYTELLGRSPSP